MSGQSTGKKISIIIPSYNSAGTIRAVLDSIAAQSRRDLVREILVVDSSDDGPTDGVLRDYSAPDIRVIKAGTRVMPAKGRNVGAKAALGDILLFLDSDTYLDPDYVEKMAAACEDGARAGSGAILLPDFQRKRLLPLVQYFLQCNEFMDTGRERQKKFGPSCNVFCEKELFEKVEGFPEIRAAEDVLFGLNLIKYTPFWFLPQARAHHIFREDTGSFIRNQVLLGKFVIKYRRMVYPSQFYYKGLWPVLFLPAFLGIKFCLITNRILRSRWELVWKYLVTLPVFLAGLLAWGVGFAKGAFSRAER